MINSSKKQQAQTKYEVPRTKDYRSMPSKSQTNFLVESYTKIPKIRNNNPGNLRPVRDRNGNIIK